MFSIKVEAGFSSAHNLREYKGKCEDLHGHNWKVEAVVRSEKLDPIGMVRDFKDFKTRLNLLLEELDHKYLNNLEPFKKINPTSENIAKYIYGRLKKQIPDLSLITVWENNTSAATYEE
ncbi:MAG: 6-carboxytetrahydropterin synthase QueD [Candidatus Omnitrophota bacterium]